MADSVFGDGSGFPEGVPEDALLPNVANDADFEKLEAGTRFRDESGAQFVKPHVVTSDADYEAVPEGADFVDSKGKRYRKPKSKPVGVLPQALYDMANTPAGKKAALELFYPGKVQGEGDELYIEEGDERRKPGADGWQTGAGAALAATAPAIGTFGGGLLGGGAGSAAPVAGTAAGAFGGMVLGAMAGRQFNNTVLSLAGIHEGLGEQIASIGHEGAFAAGGEALGRGIVYAGGKALRLGQKASEFIEDKLPGGLPGVARRFLGTDETRLRQAKEITDRFNAGLKASDPEAESRGIVRPSVLAPGSPMLGKWEEFEQAFNKSNMFDEAARDYYEQQSKALLESSELGHSIDDLLTHAEAKVSSERAGQLTLAAARKDMAASDADLENAWREARSIASGAYEGAGGPEEVAKLYKAATDKLVAKHAEAAKAAKDLV